MRIPRPAWRRDLSGPTPPWVAQVLRGLACALVAALIALPVAAERAVEQVRFDDHLGTFPVEVGLCHDGRSTLDTGLFGKVFWGQTGSYGFGAYARATGPPEAGGTLASYVDPKFIQANVALIDDPDRTVDAYAAELSSDLRQHLLRDELLAATLGGGLLFLLVPRGPWPGVSRRRQLATTTALAAVGAVLSVGIAGQLFATWDCNDPSGTVYSIPGVDNLYFGSPETREIAAQVKPFIDKNTRRIEQQGNAYEDAATASFTSALARRSAELHPRSGERLVIAEADPQGSFVGVHVRTVLYDALATALDPDPISLRTIAGDVSSNGTVAEAAYIKAEAKVGGEVPVAAVGGDHDSTRTWQQMVDDGIELPDLDTVEIGDLQVSGANDREHKALFGVLVTNEEGISEEELGARLRTVVDKDGPDGARGRIVLLHQPDAVAGYLGLDDLVDVRAVDGSLTTPYDDGIADQPPGVVDIGHLHATDGPWVLWNTDGDEITWTVVDQLGTAGGVENTPTFSRFSTPLSAPLKVLSVRLQYMDAESGLETGFVTVSCSLEADCTISERTDVGLPGGKPRPNDTPGRQTSGSP